MAGAFQLALGQLADLVGRKLMFIAGMGSFSALVLLTGFAQNAYWMLILCGALGIPSAMVVPPAMGILGAAYKTPSRRKTSAFAAFSAGNPLGFVCGSIVCGVASSVSSWRAAVSTLESPLECKLLILCSTSSWLLSGLVSLRSRSGRSPTWKASSLEAR